MGRTWTDDDLRKALPDADSLADVIRGLGLVPRGANYATVKLRIKQLGLDTSHILGRAHMRGKVNTFSQKPLSDHLRKGRSVNGASLRRRLVREGIWEHRCYGCNRVTWQKQPIPLELHHKDGDNTNNELDNLQQLCPNCHALTNTYRGKNIQAYAAKNPLKYNCPDCGKEKARDGRCFPCAMRAMPPEKRRKVVNRPSLSTLKREVSELGYCGTGRKYGVSDNAVRKWIKAAD